ncbi:hypothetical protein EAX61_13410 [Dokdonia sinensis]|uniref:Uncharacterized protein n=1 Tax=Dokdonia sinensis TaxID=2479847 RepID=A0A3M0G6Q9_9FLAO|nr:hypothetical protein [Dokdonia sinensis]RMB56789.1 hypothetical protein EAX61_13410 [Dokdonia sinensis]
MGTKNIFFKYFFIILITTTSCSLFSDDDGCSDDQNDSRPITVEGLLEITPLNTEYNQGDIIEVTLTLPSANNFFSTPVDLFDETGTIESWIEGFDHTELTAENTITLESGRLENNGRAYVIYNEDNNDYELIYRVTLERTGTYEILVSPSYRLRFPTNNACDFEVETSLNGFSTEEITNFTFEVTP